METMIVNIALAALGMLAHILSKAQAVREKGLEFKGGVWLQQNLINTILSVVAIAVIFLLHQDMTNIFGIHFSKLTCFGIGWMSDSLFRNITQRVEGIFKI